MSTKRIAKTPLKWAKLRPTLTLLALLGTGSLFSAQAAINNVAYTLISDGEAGWDDPADNRPGLDSGPNNKLVRTNDNFQYQVSLSTTGGDTGVTIVVTLPKGDTAPRVGQNVAVWAYLSPDCDPATSTISTDRQTMTCVLGNIDQAGTKPATFTATVLGTTPNKTNLPAPGVVVKSSVGLAPAPSSLPPTIAVTAAPYYDTVIDLSYNGNPKAYAFSAASGPNNEDGYFHRPLIGLVAKNPYGNGNKGVEQLATDVNFAIDISGYPSGTLVDNWHTGIGPAGTPAATGSFMDGCGSPGVGVPSAESGAGVNMYSKVQDTGKTAATSTNASYTVPNGGDCAVTSSSATTVNLTVSGIDTSLATFPTKTQSTGTAIPKSDVWVMNKALVLWTPLSSYPNNVPTNNTIQFGSYSATSISGQAILGDLTNNNSQNYQITTLNSGAASKIYTADTSRAYPYGTECDPGVSGNCLVNFMSPDQTVKSYVRYQNTGALTQSNIFVCDVLDRTVFDLGLNNSRSNFLVTTGAISTPPTIRYGTRAAGRYFASTDAGDASTTIGNTSSVRGAANAGSAYSTAKCDDPSIVWYTSAANAEAAGGLVYVRADFPQVLGNEAAILYVQGLTLRRTYAADINVIWPAATTRKAGTPVDADTFIRNTGTVGGTGFPSLDNSVHWDNLKVVPIRTTSRITKDITAPSNNPPVLAAGNTVIYTLQPTYTTTFPPQANTVTATDILPPGLGYVSGSATVGGIGREPQVFNNDPASGHTRLVWTYPNQLPYVLNTGNNTTGPNLPPIVFKATIGAAVANSSTLINSAAVSGGNNVDYTPDCVYSTATQTYGTCVKATNRSVTVQTSPGFKLSKTTPISQIEAGQNFKFTISYVNFGQGSTSVDIPDLIDILPFVGDGTGSAANSFSGRSPASGFTAGAYQLQSVTVPGNDPSMTVYYTSAAPSTINNDPRHASNALSGGTTQWCTAAQLGTVGCPANVASATAVRLHPGVSSMAANVTYSVDLNFVSTTTAKMGNIFNNSVGARPVDPSSPLLYVEAPAVSPVRVVSSSLSGQVFYDANQNGGLDTPPDIGLASVCVVLTGTTNGGASVTNSILTATDGTYSFAFGVANRVYPSADCTGTVLPMFAGLNSGTYTVKELNQPVGYSDGKDYAGTAGGTVGNDQISSIVLGVGANATGYNFTETLPVLGVSKQVSLNFLKVTPDANNDSQLTYSPSPAQLTYTIEVTNTGFVPANNVVVTDVLPSGLTYNSSTPAASATNGQTLTFNLATLNAGASQIFTVVTTATITANTNQAALLNTASAKADNTSPITSAPAKTDVVYAKLSKRVHNLGQNPATSPIPQTTVWNDTDITSQGLPGDVMEYCIDFYNYGSVALSNYQITDNVPAQTTIVPNSWVVKQGSMTSAGNTPLAGASVNYANGTVTATIASLPANTVGTLCFRAKIK